MKARGVWFALLIGAGLASAGTGVTYAGTSEDSTNVAATAPAKDGAPADHKYMGVKRCKLCHNAEKTGAQFTKWSGTKHAKAYEALGSSLAKTIAAKKGIADPQKDAACLKCHQTGYGLPADRFGESFVATDGVQCESCHGPGSDYMKKSVMTGIADGTLKAEDYGLVMPTKERCAGCHNSESPTFVEMNFSADSTKIAHPNPLRHKGAGSDGATK